jgi:hypothetical protein
VTVKSFRGSGWVSMLLTSSTLPNPDLLAGFSAPVRIASNRSALFEAGFELLAMMNRE